jgi:mycothiol synthase
VPRRWRRAPSLTPDQRLDVLDLLNRTEVRLGREAVDEGRRRLVVHGGVAEHWLGYDGRELAGYAQLMGEGRPTLEMCGGGVDEALLAEVLARHQHVDWWTRGHWDGPEGQVVRTLQMLGVRLPVPVSGVPEGATLRSFEPGRDDRAWIEQNNSAFADHPEQGAWREPDLADRVREPWFDPSGFLLLEVDGRIAASCWTKVHELYLERLGEIYVISVHPDFRGRGLGRVMVTQGLDALRRKGVGSAILFVDDSNGAARALYKSLGFFLQREDQLIHYDRVAGP